MTDRPFLLTYQPPVILIALAFVSIAFGSALACQTTEDLAKAPAIEFEVPAEVRKRLLVGKPGTEQLKWAPVSTEKVKLNEGEWIHANPEGDGNLVEGLKSVAPRLYSLNLRPASDGALIGIKELKQLRELEVDGQCAYESGFKGTAFDELAALENLEFVTVLSAECTDASIAQIAKIKSLRRFNLSPSQSLTEKCFKPFKEAIRLKSLRLGSFAKQDDAMADIAQIPNLEELDLRSCNSLTSTGVGYLASTKLQSLVLVGCVYIDDEAAKSIAQIKTLKHLDLGAGVQLITLEGYKAIATLTLERLEMMGNFSIGDDEVAALCAIKTLKYLDISITNVTDKCVDSLAKLTNLETLKIFETVVTQTALDRLKKSTPKLEIITKR